MRSVNKSVLASAEKWMLWGMAGCAGGWGAADWGVSRGCSTTGGGTPLELAGVEARATGGGSRARAVLGRRWVCLAVLTLGWLSASAESSRAVGTVSFSRQVAPIFAAKCQTCHGTEKAKGGFRLHTYAALMRGGRDHEAVIVKGSPSTSKLYQLLTTKDEDDRMPQKGEALSSDEIRLIGEWIGGGAIYDGSDSEMELARLVPGAGMGAAPEIYPQAVPVCALCFSRDGEQLAVGGFHEILIWKWASEHLEERIGKLPERIQGLVLSPDGQFWAVATGSPGRAGQVNLISVAAPHSVRVLAAGPDVMMAVAFTPDGKRLIAGGADNAIHILSIESAKEERVIQQHADWVMGLAVSSDGKRIASASRDRTARIYDTGTGELMATYTEHEAPVFAVAFSRDNERVISAGQDRKIHVWNRSDGKKVREFSGLEGDPFHLLLEDEDLFSCGAEASVREFSLNDGKAVRSLRGLDDWNYSLACDAGARHLAAGGFGGMVAVWDAKDGKLVKRWQALPMGRARIP